MDRTELEWLRSATGQALLTELAQRDIRDATVLPELTRLRRDYPPAFARAALEQSLLRRRARTKFTQADQLFFTREALEQASSEWVARCRSARFASYARVADLCCGIGGDALALAACGSHVIAVDRDETRLALATANAAAQGLSDRVTFEQRDLLATAPPHADALFCDPGRRKGGKRRFLAEQYEPPLSLVLGWRAQTPALAVKLAPGVDTSALPTDDVELEFVSLDGELKEAVLWCGPLATTRRRATLLRRDAPTTVHTLVEQSPRPVVAVAPPSQFLYEPDPAVIRAGLVAEVAVDLGATQLDSEIAYFTAATARETPFARRWRIHSWFPFNLKQIRARLRDLDAGAVTVKKRGSPLDANALARTLSGKGAQPWVVVLTQAAGKPIVLICDDNPKA